ncbi:Rrf2 family transcriptional regulator [bacterium]|nr:Rrf2 family transcriptional regulator [bacterium]MBU1614214.1 Rrf2 family transcriptional regulator [bacterium]
MSRTFLKKLRKAGLGLVESIRGSQGRYCLSRPRSEISAGLCQQKYGKNKVLW